MASYRLDTVPRPISPSRRPALGERCRLLWPALRPVRHDAPPQGHDKKGKRKAPAAAVEPLERFSEGELMAAQLMLEEEALFVRQSQKHKALDPVEVATVSSYSTRHIDCVGQTWARGAALACRFPKP